MNQQRFVNIFLNNVSSFWSFLLRFPYDIDDIIDCLCNLDSLAAVSVLSRLDDPVITKIFIILFEVHPFFILFITRMNMESDRKSKPWVSSFSCVELLEIDEKGFLVWKMMILRQLVIDFEFFSFDRERRLFKDRQFIDKSVLLPRTPYEINSIFEWSFFKYLHHLNSLFNNTSYKKRVIALLTKELECIPFLWITRKEGHLILIIDDLV